jgi:hypothetical protein
MAHYRIIGNALGYPWVNYVCSDVINEHERVCREHTCGPHGLHVVSMNYGTGDPGSIPGTVNCFMFFFKFIFWGTPGCLG